MEDGYYCAHYKILPHCRVRLAVLAERSVFVELLDGDAFLKSDGMKSTLSRLQRYPLESLNPVLSSDSGCSFKVYGRHEVIWCEQVCRETRRMFEILEKGTKLLFLLGQRLQITIFHREEIRSVIIEIEEPEQQVFGPVLLLRRNSKQYYLPPFSQFLIQNNFRSSSLKIAIYEPLEKIGVSISPYDFDHLEDTITDIRRRCGPRPKVLILGNSSVTKIAFPHVLFNDAFKKLSNPLYVDLNVRQNSNGIPGSLRIIQVSGRRIIDERGCHKSEILLGNNENIFSFGYVDPESNIKLYYLLLNRLAALASQMGAHKITRNFGTIIDMCDSLSNNLMAVTRVINAFHVNAIVVVGDGELYDSIKMTNKFVSCCLRFIPETEEFPQPSYNLHNSEIREYLFWSQNVFLIKFSDIRVCEIISEGVTDNIESSTVITLQDVRTVPVACSEHLQNHLLGVSVCSTEAQTLPVIRVKYFVYILKVDMEKEILRIKSPKGECPSGAILIKGDIKLLTENEP